MKKFGFTLAEVLITLGIIGIVASLTAPALTKNTGAAKIGPALAKFVNTFETATEQMMHDEGVSRLDDLFKTASDTNNSEVTNVLKKLASYMVMTPYNDNTYKVYAPAANSNVSVTPDANRQKWLLKDGTLISYIESDSDYIKSYTQKGSYLGPTAGIILFDINGPGGKNKAGKEVFAFKLDQNGTLVPVGGSVEHHLAGSNKSSCSQNATVVANGLACTGKIADNNWTYDDKK